MKEWTNIINGNELVHACQEREVYLSVYLSVCLSIYLMVLYVNLLIGITYKWVVRSKIELQSKKFLLEGIYDERIAADESRTRPLHRPKGWETRQRAIEKQKHKILLDDYKVRPELKKHKNI